jgi:hypothetical protein
LIAFLNPKKGGLKRQEITTWVHLEKTRSPTGTGIQVGVNVAAKVFCQMDCGLGVRYRCAFRCKVARNRYTFSVSVMADED